MSEEIIVETIEIPETIANKLSKLLAKESIRRQLLNDSINDESKYEKAEARLIPIINEINQIKHMITEKYIPNDFRSDRFIWSYNGYDIDGTHINIIKQW